MEFFFPPLSILIRNRLEAIVAACGIITSLFLARFVKKISMDLESAFKKIRSLQQELNNRENDVQLAAKYGKQLLDEKAKLQKTIESLKQEKHDMQVRFDSDRKSNDFSYEDRMQEFKENVSLEYKTNKMKYDAENVKIVEQLRKEIGMLHSEIEMLKDSEARTCENNEFLKKKLIEMENSQGGNTTCSSFSSDFFHLENEKLELQNKNVHLETQINTLKQDFDNMTAKENALKNEVFTLESQIKDKEILLKEYLDALQASKEEVAELKMEIVNLKLNTTDVNRKGNSLFSEVEDRRKKQERELVTLRAEHETAKHNITVLQQQITRQKLKISTLHSTTAAKFDASYVEQIESLLKDSRAEIKSLTIQLQLQEQNTKKDKGRRLSDTGDDYAYLTAMLKSSQKRVAELDAELQSKRLAHWSDTERMAQIQKKSVESEQVVDKLKSEMIKLRCQNEDFKKNCRCEFRSEDRKEVKEAFVMEKIPVGGVQSKTVTPYGLPVKREKITPHSTDRQARNEKCEQQ